eukprot:TRINITY_DN20907_c0_g1_i1.p3 TRINITY_DN20907_c0_g1~~TRINITY_DN20907_c0_g1_i1.p3  ORF type:complete len:103 (+),score=16.04 TRINITY_DN20907_c0_g1_i1:180-488(+)
MCIRDRVSTQSTWEGISTGIKQRAFFSGMKDKKTTTKRVHSKVNLYTFKLLTFFFRQGYNRLTNAGIVHKPLWTKKFQQQQNGFTLQSAQFPVSFFEIDENV